MKKLFFVLLLLCAIVVVAEEVPTGVTGSGPNCEALDSSCYAACQEPGPPAPSCLAMCRELVRWCTSQRQGGYEQN